MATLAELQQAYLDAWGYVPARIQSWTGDVTDADVARVLASGTAPAPTESTAETTTAPSSSGGSTSYAPAPPTTPIGWTPTPAPNYDFGNLPATVPTAPTTTSTASVYVPIQFEGTPLAQIWLDAWIETNDPEQALAAVQRAPEYDDIFPGNRRPDGSVRYTEMQYLSILESFDDALLSINLNPDLFQWRYPDLIAGLVSPAEFTNRIEQVYDGIIDRTPQVAEYYAQTYGINLTPEAIVASFIDPDLGDQIMQGRVEVAQVGGAAASKGFTIVQDFAQQLVHAGMDTESEASQFFALAQGALPTLSALASRHADPDDDFSLEEFAAASVFTDPEQRSRLRRLLAQERSDFSQNAFGPIARAETGVSTGLYER